MAYRTLKQPGPGETRGLKITTRADIAVNRMLSMGQQSEARNLYSKIREGGAPTNTGTYTLNGHVCYHVKFDGQAHALAWRAPKNDTFAYIEAVLAKTGQGNSYAEL